jgi:hypothetical protein
MDDRDQELVAAFLQAVKGRSSTDIQRTVPGVTKNDVSRWKHEKFKRVTDEKRSALLRFLTQQTAGDGSRAGSLTEMVGPLLSIARAAAELAEIAARGTTSQDREAERAVENRLRALVAARSTKSSA